MNRDQRLPLPAWREPGQQPRSLLLARSDGGREWWCHGRRHREDGPAVERPDGSREWWLDGRLHREDGPAVVWHNGRREWWCRGRLHRDGGPAVERSDGTREWYRRGRLHREDGPAVEHADGTREWWVRGRLHREDGPAIERPDGSVAWYRDGKYWPDPSAPDTLGWRTWVWERETRLLRSPYWETPWPSAEMTAEAWSDEAAVETRAGIHALRLPRGDWRTAIWPDGVPDGTIVTGIVERWGRYVLGEGGWRSEHARIRELLAPAPEIQLALIARYPGVRVHLGRPAV